MVLKGMQRLRDGNNGIQGKEFFDRVMMVDGCECGCTDMQGIHAVKCL